MTPSEIINWNSHFYANSPIFYPITNTQHYFQSFSSWPTLIDYNQFISDRHIRSENNRTIYFVKQDEKPQSFEQHYEPRIFLDGEIQTRENNWHDFFQVLVWNNFPHTKATLNHLHYKEAFVRNTQKGSQPNRSPLENAITLFDECGCIIVSSDQNLLSLIKNAQWKELFWNNREHIKTRLKIFVFGHALYEKALKPYIGMTSHSLLLSTSHSFFSTTLEQQLSYIDEETSSLFKQGEIKRPKRLTPVPVLGYPKWHSNNDDEQFYDNKAYFRERKRKS